MAGTQQITVLAVPRHHVHNIPLHAIDDRQETIIFRVLGEIDSARYYIQGDLLSGTFT